MSWSRYTQAHLERSGIPSSCLTTIGSCAQWWLAVKWRDFAKMTRLILTCPGIIEARNSGDMTALMMAAEKLDYKMVSSLLTYGANARAIGPAGFDIDAGDALSFVPFGMETLEELYEDTHRPDIDPDIFSVSSMRAVHLKVVRRLLNAGCDAKAVLHMAEQRAAEDDADHDLVDLLRSLAITPRPAPAIDAASFFAEHFTRLEDVGDGNCYGYGPIGSLGLLEHDAASHGKPTSNDLGVMGQIRHRQADFLLSDDPRALVIRTWYDLNNSDGTPKTESIEPMRNGPTYRADGSHELGDWNRQWYMDSLACVLSIDIVSYTPSKNHDVTTYFADARQLIPRQEAGVRTRTFPKMRTNDVAARLQAPTPVPLAVSEWNGSNHYTALVPKDGHKLIDGSTPTRQWLLDRLRPQVFCHTPLASIPFPHPYAPSACAQTRLPVAGLVNTTKWLCFLSSVLQAVCATPGVRGAFYDRMRTQADALSPSEILNFLAAKSGIAKRWVAEQRHQDSQEALEVLLRHMPGWEQAVGVKVSNLVRCGCDMGESREVLERVRLPDGQMSDSFVCLSLALTGPTIDDCIAAFCAESETDKPCDLCERAKFMKQSVSAKRIVVLHLKRFDNNAAKITSACKFDLEMVKFGLRLKLYAVLKHGGDSIEEGHNTSFVRYGAEWVLCDDRDVRRATLDEVMHSDDDSQPYLLFYENVEPVRATPMRAQYKSTHLRAHSHPKSLVLVR